MRWGRRHGADCNCRGCSQWRSMVQRLTPGTAPLYIAECRDCPSLRPAGIPATLVMTFEHAGDRNRWAWQHAVGAGHSVHLRTRPRHERAEYPP